MHCRKSYRISRFIPTAASIAAITAIASAQPVGYDFNGDGSSDFPVSVISYDQANPDVGAARIWSGASKSIIQTIVSTDTNTLFGWSTASAGDLDGDGKDDLIVGEPFWSAGSNYEGRISVFSGADASVLLTIPGPYIDTGLGRYVTGVGDWNGDGTIDIASSGWDIADTNFDGVGDNAIGIVFVFSGVDGSVLAEISDPVATSGFGYSVFGLGDITGDGNGDIAIVDRNVEPTVDSGIYGEIYIFTGSVTVGTYDITDAHSIIPNTDVNARGFGAQIDIMHPDLWLDKPTLQIVSLTYGESGGVNEAEIMIDIMKTDGVITGTKGIRPTLKLAGDVNLDGKVDALDIQDSISQLGTDPQAIGVMPIVDSNNDNIIDALDIQVVMDGYGQTTDIYDGLWDGTRLLAIAGSSAGFGSITGIGISPGGTGFGGGPRPRPSDDCNFIISPPDLTGTILPFLLREDAGKNCSECPECEDPQRDCYDCENAGTMQGGTVTASPTQPTLGQEVTFTIEPLTINGRTRKCQSDCGDEGTECPIDMNDLHPCWVIEAKDATGAWVPIPGKFGCTPTATFTSESACLEVRLRTIPRIIAKVENCEELESTEETAEVKFADFYLEIVCDAETPTNKSRNKIGIKEGVEVFARIDSPDAPGGYEGVLVSWEIVVGSEPPTTPYASDATWFSAPYLLAGETETITVTATSNSCSRTETFTVVTPNAVRFERRASRDFHVDGLASAGLGACVTVLPDDVSFTGLAVGEGDGLPTVVTGQFVTAGWASRNHQDWSLIVGECNIVNPLADFTWFYMYEPAGGYVESTCTYHIPFMYGQSLLAVDQIFSTVDGEYYIKETVGTAEVSRQNREVYRRFGVDAPDMNPLVEVSPGKYEPSWTAPFDDCPCSSP